MQGTVYNIAVIISFFCGYILRLIQEKLTRRGTFDTLQQANALEEIFMFVIIVIWVVANVVSYFIPNKEVPLAVHILMGSVFGYLFRKDNPILQGIQKGITIVKENGNKTNGGKDN